MYIYFKLNNVMVKENKTTEKEIFYQQIKQVNENWIMLVTSIFLKNTHSNY